MDLTEKLSSVSWLSGKKHVNATWIIVLALFGVVLIGAAAYLGFSEWRVGRLEAAAKEEADAAVRQLQEPLQSIKPPSSAGNSPERLAKPSCEP